MNHQQSSGNEKGASANAAAYSVDVSVTHSAPATPTVPSHPPTPPPATDRYHSYPPLQQHSPSHQAGSYHICTYQTMATISSPNVTLMHGSSDPATAATGNLIKAAAGGIEQHPTLPFYPQYYQQQHMYSSGGHLSYSQTSPANSPVISSNIPNPNLSAVTSTTSPSVPSIAPIRTSWSPAPVGSAQSTIAGDNDSLGSMFMPAQAGSTPTTNMEVDANSLTQQFFANGPTSAPMYPPPSLHNNDQALPSLNTVMSSVYRQGSSNASLAKAGSGTGFSASPPMVFPNGQFASQQPHSTMLVQQQPANGQPSGSGYRVRLKPPMPYPVLLAMCIMEAPNSRLTLRQIYEALRNKYPEIYRETARRFSSWENTVRYNLSRCGVFEKLARRTANGTSTTNGVNEPSSKGSWWTIRPEWRVKIETHGFNVLKDIDGRRHEKAEKEGDKGNDGTGSRKQGTRTSTSASGPAKESALQQAGASQMQPPATTTQPLAVPASLSAIAASMTDALGLPAITSPISVTGGGAGSDFSGNGSLSPVMVTGLGSARNTPPWSQPHMLMPANSNPDSVMSSSASVTPPIHSPVPSPRGFASPFVNYTGAYYLQQQPNASPAPAHFVSPYACIVSPTSTNGFNGGSCIPFGSYPQQQQEQQQHYQQFPATMSSATAYMPPVCLPEQAPVPSDAAAQQSSPALPDWAANAELLNGNGHDTTTIGSRSGTTLVRYPPPPQLDPMPTHHFNAHAAYETHCSQAGGSSLPLAVALEGSVGGRSAANNSQVSSGHDDGYPPQPLQ